MRNNAILSIAVYLVTSACSAMGSVTASDTESTRGLEVDMDNQPIKVIKSVPSHASGKIAGDAAMKKMLLMAREDLAKRLQIDRDAIEVLEARYVTWRDSSYGCPQPNTQYMQVLTSGARIKLLAGKKTYYYHQGGKRPMFYCDHVSRVEPLPGRSGDA